MKTHKRSKNSRIRGARTCGWGFRQKHKGHGNRGGVGMAGSGKRADHKKQKALSMDKKKKYFGAGGLTTRGSKIIKEDKINLRDIKDNFFKKDGDKIDLKKNIILGVGEGFKAEIIAKKASRKAIEKMEKAGGKIILPVKKEKPTKEVVEKKEEKKAEKKEEAAEEDKK
jgi:large subunit ribosomal protein L15